MKILVQAILILILIPFNSGLSNNFVNKPVMLFDALYNNDEWELLDTDNGLSVFTKNVNDKNLKAVMVKKELELPKEVLQNVIMDVDNYKKFLRNSESFISLQIKKTTNFVDGYQFIPIEIPFFDNREYIFRMTPSGFKKEDSTSIIHWFLLDKDPFFLDNDERSATYLDYGAGLWTAEEKGEDKILFSYRIYMDPGGSLPDFLIDMINKTSVINIFKDAISEAQKRHSKSY
tara:strand:- start:347 stop:1042 length:696 start_codon:yes stop_codon:yes gene_type:complete